MGKGHDEVFEFDVEDTETQVLVLQVKDEDIGTDRELGITTIPLHGLAPDTEIEITKKLAPSLDTVRVKDKGDRGTITVKLFYHPYTTEESEIALALEKRELKAKEDLKNGGVVDNGRSWRKFEARGHRTDHRWLWWGETCGHGCWSCRLGRGVCWLRSGQS